MQKIKPRRRSNVKKTESYRKSLQMHDRNIRSMGQHKAVRYLLSVMIDIEPLYVMKELEELNRLNVVKFPDYAMKLTKDINDKVKERKMAMGVFLLKHGDNIDEEVKLEKYRIRYLDKLSDQLTGKVYAIVRHNE